MTLYLVWYVIYALWPFFEPGNWQAIVSIGFVAAFDLWWQDYWNKFSNHLLYFLLAGGKAYHLWFLPSLAMAVIGLALSLYLRAFWLGVAGSIAFFLVALLAGPYAKTSLGFDLGINMRNGPFF